MGLYKFKPTPSGRMGILWTLSTVKNSALIEFSCMGHMFYSGATLKRNGIVNACNLYSTHIDETDISLGITERLNHTVKNVIKEKNPEVIFLTPSSIPEVIGTDLFALSQELEINFPDTKFIPFEYGGFDIKQHKGVRETLLKLSQSLAKDCDKTNQPTFNIVGSCADMFNFKPDTDEIKRLLKGSFDMEPVCIMTSDTSVQEIKKLGSAYINIVLREEGLKTAEYLEKRFGTPFIYKRPYGIKDTKLWLEKISEILNISLNSEFLNNEICETKNKIMPAIPNLMHLVRSHPEEATISLGGHTDVVKGILSFLTKELHFTKGTCWCNSEEMSTEEIPYFSEEKWIEVFKNHKSGYLMSSGESLKWAGYDLELQIANPDTKWRLFRYSPPLVGFRGTVNLINILINHLPED